MSVELLNAKRVAELLECDETTVGLRALAGELPGVKIGRGWVFPIDALNVRLNEMALDGARVRRAQQKEKKQVADAPLAVSFAPTLSASRRRPPVKLPELVPAGGDKLSPVGGDRR